MDINFKPPTRRGILSLISSVYDPLGLAATFVLPAKRLLQDLCRVKLDWDDPIPQEHKVRWERWMADLPKLSQFSVDRCVKPAGFDFISSSQLHHFRFWISFLPLSRQWPGCCSLFLSVCQVPCGASKTITIPRLELSAAAISVKQDKVLKRELEIPKRYQLVPSPSSGQIALRYYVT